MPENVNIVALAEALSQAGSPAVELVRVDASDVAIIPFTPTAVRVHLHYCHEPDLGGYVRCYKRSPADRCVLCAVGRHRDERLLLPVYLPVGGSVGVLPVSTSQRPNSLLPQLLPFLKADAPRSVLFVRRETIKFYVSSAALQPGDDDGAAVIKVFAERMRSEDVRLEEVYPLFGNEQIAQIPEIAKALHLRGLSP
jgi:hypothetical protein